jgi:hypothetical protein
MNMINIEIVLPTIKGQPSEKKVKTISEVSQLCTIALDQGKFVL